ncbi:serine hydrolase [Microbacterium sp. RD1]|uniref:serine hydrolase n=1 Tax=Microbacterium sp. RD1 TaxID=3457313 RepID=UPI003FA5A83A
MSRPLTRRAVLLGATALALTACAPSPSRTSPSPLSASPTASSAEPVASAAPVALDLSDLPAGSFGVWGTLAGATVVHDAQVRLRMCSTMKLPLTALVLAAHAQGRLELTAPLSWRPSDVRGYSPVTSADADGMATIAELSEATARTSDNTAANLLLDAVGGLPAMNAFVRGLGDDVTRFDRYEPAMNEREGDLDTTTAEAFGRLALALPGALGPSGTTQLRAWLPGRDGRRIAATAPAGLDLRHKTGSSGDGAVNDVAILFYGDAVLGSLAIFTDSAGASEELVAEIARRAFQALGA